MKKIALYGAFGSNMLECLQKKCPAGFETYPVSEGDLECLAQADYIVNRGGEIDARVMSAAPGLRLIQKWGAGYDKIDVKAAGKKGIPVSICVGGNALPVAELAVTLMLDVLRNVVPMAECMKRGDWARDRFSPRSYLLHGKTVGLIGIGNIAKKVASIVQNGFQCQVLYNDIVRLPPEQEAALNITYADLNALMAQSDIISVHVPLLDSTRNMINQKTLSRMKPTACLINTARGGIIHEPDLIAALKSGTLLGAGLDTFSTEPLPGDSALLALDNVVTLPHCGGNTVDNDINMAAICMECIVQHATSGYQSMQSIVNRDFLNQ